MTFTAKPPLRLCNACNGSGNGARRPGYRVSCEACDGTGFPAPRGIGDLIREGRLRQRITQAELARRTGIRQPTISKIESGCHNPTVTILSRLADGLGLGLVIALENFIPPSTPEGEQNK